MLSACSSPPVSSSPKVILFYASGASDQRVDTYLREDILPADGGFAHLARQGIQADYVHPIEAPLTATSRASMVTGAPPEIHGIVENVFHSTNTPIHQAMSGFVQTPFTTETLWESAERQGKQVIRLGTLFLTGSDTAQVGLTLGAGQALSPQQLVSLTTHTEASWSSDPNRFEHTRALQPLNTSDGIRFASSHPHVQNQTLHVLAVDTLYDGHETFQALYIDGDRDLQNGYYTKLSAGDWATLILSQSPNLIGVQAKLLALAPDLTDIRLYLGPPQMSRGYPAAFVQDLEHTLGPWPGDPDYGAFAQGWIDEATWREQSLRQNQYILDAAHYAIETYPYDLLIVYQPMIDNTVHQFLLTDPRQAGYNDDGGEKRKRYARYIEESYQHIDAHLNTLIKHAGDQTHVLAVSNYGLAPAHTRFALNNVLAQAGFTVTNDNQAEVKAYTSSTNAHIYINLAGRQPSGIVPQAMYTDYVNRMATTLRTLRDPITNDPVLDQVITRSALHNVQMAHTQRAGDVWVRARPGYTFTQVLSSTQPLTDRPFLPGDHGYAPDLRVSQGIFYAAGPTLPQGPLGPIRTLDIAPTISALLNIMPPAGHQGTVIPVLTP